MKWCTHHAVLWSGWVATVGQVYVQQHYVPKEWGQLTNWINRMTRLFHQCIFSSLMARAYSKMTMLGFLGLKMWKRCMRPHFHTWIGHHRLQTPDLNLIENLWDVLEKALRSCLTLPSSIQNLGEELMQHWMEINLVTLQYLIKTMP